MQEQQFEFSAGNVALDFANTVGGTRSSPTEHVHSYADLLTWADQAGLVQEHEVRLLRQLARRSPGASDAAYRRATALREAIFRVFDARAQGRLLPSADLATLDRETSAAHDHRSLRQRADGVIEYTWRAEEQLHLPTWCVALAATDLLLANMSVVRECAAETCEWLFVDRSRNRSRRWCDMRECGNRAKVRRYQARLRSRGRSK